MEPISSKQRQILDFIAGFLDERGYAPSVRDVARGCSVSSSSVAQYHINILKDRGYISREPDLSRSIALPNSRSSAAIPILGTIAAGKPIPVPWADTWASTPEETIDVPTWLTCKRDKLYALKVKGTSMIDALIDDGDIVILQTTSVAKEGETVAVWLKDRQEVTLKRIYYVQGKICLKPANSLMTPIYCEPDKVEIQGKVVAVLRKL